MKKASAFLLLITLAFLLVSCSSSSNSGASAAVMPNVTGSWEFLLTSSANPGYSTGLEVSMQEGQVLTNGVYLYNGQISAASSQISFVGFTPTQAIVFGGNCAPAADNTGNGLTGSISGIGGSMNFTFTENGNVFNVTATLDASGQFIDSGTYTSQSGSACSDSGTITSGKIVPKLSGTYSGQLQVNENSDSATATLTESSGNASLSLVLTGADNTTLTLTGPVTGNAFFVQGTYQGSQIAYYGYYEVTVQMIEGAQTNVPAIYLSSTGSPSQQAGFLMTPQAP